MGRDTPPQQDDSTRARPLRRRWWRAAAGLVAVGLLAVGLISALAIWQGLAARDDLEQGRRELAKGQTALLQGRPTQATQAAGRAADAFDAARARTRGPVLGLAAVTPVIGPSARTLAGVAQASAHTGAAARELAAAFDRLPGGLAALAPRDGALPLEPVQRLAAPLARAQRQLARAEAAVRATPASWTPNAVARARADALAEVSAAHRTIRGAAALARELPVFLGAEGPRRYFFGAQNPAELRGTGGIMGAYALLRADRGRISFQRFGPIQSLRDLPPGTVPAPNPSFAKRYDRYGGTGFWLNINMSPDFPAAATAVERLFERVTGTAVDGTVMADPFALEALLRVAGPAQLPGNGDLGAGTVVDFVANRAYAVFDSAEQRKALLGQVAASVLARFLDTPQRTDAGRAARIVGGAVADGHLLFHARDPEVQAAFAAAGMHGGLPDGEGDFLAVVGNNAAANKVDYYTTRRLSYRAALQPDGSVEGEATVRLRNNAPRQGAPRYVLGPSGTRFRPGENYTILDLFCARACTLTDFRRDGRRAGVRLERERGLRVVSTTARLPSGGAQRLGFDLRTPAVWRPSGGGGTYTLTIRGQPAIQPTMVDVDVAVPEGTRVVSTHPAMQVDAGHARYHGQATNVQRFSVTFRRPLLGRLRDVLTRPVFRLGLQ